MESMAYLGEEDLVVCSFHHVLLELDRVRNVQALVDHTRVESFELL
jgi:hypothetical protein